MNSLSIVAVGLLMDRHVRGSEDLRALRARILLQIVSSLHSICAGEKSIKLFLRCD
jgi:hypothetical protein